MTNTVKLWVFGPLVFILVSFVGVHLLLRKLLPPIELPAYEQVQVKWLDQNWTPDDWQWFYHASQGGALSLPIPYDWAAAFERPEVPFLFGTFTGMLMDEEYISRYGFLPNPKESYDVDGMTLDPDDLPGLSTLRQDEQNNPSHFPVGFVRTRDFTDRATNRTTDMLGLTCAACHTGQINVEGIGYRIEGGPAMTDLGKFRSGIGKAMGLTYFSGLVSFMPVFNRRWNRFADRVLGKDRTSEQTADLKEWMRSVVSRGKATAEVEKERNIYPVEEGFSRLDAIERIGNFVFAVELDSVVNSVNWSQASAPVNFPHIWDSPWFEWVQYNGSFKQPMMRNVGEAMGVYADVDLLSVDDHTGCRSRTGRPSRCGATRARPPRRSRASRRRTPRPTSSSTSTSPAWARCCGTCSSWSRRTSPCATCRAGWRSAAGFATGAGATSRRSFGCSPSRAPIFSTSGSKTIGSREPSEHRRSSARGAGR